MGHTAKVYNLRQHITQFKQGNQLLSIYYSSFQKMWDELTHYTTYRLACIKDDTIPEHIENIQIFEFLDGPNPEYEQVRAFILGIDHLLSLNEVYTHIHRDDKC